MSAIPQLHQNTFPLIGAIAAVELRWNLQGLIVLQPYKVILFERITENTG